MGMTATTAHSVSSNGSAPAWRAVQLPSSRITPADLEELARRVTTGGPREPLEIEQPFTGQPLGAVPTCTTEDVELAYERARAAQQGWRKSSFAERRTILLRMHDLVLDRQDEILDIMQMEAGKARRHAFE